MKILGFDITRKAAPNTLQSVDAQRGMWFRILESFAGAWQTNVEVRLESVLTHPTVFACVTLIASDVAKMTLELVQRMDDGIWVPTERAAFSPVLKIPNPYQDQKKFLENWMFSKLIWGNTYVLKGYDQRRVVNALYILDPARVRPLVAPDGSVWYEIKRDDLARQQQENLIVPAADIIHDRMWCLYHPLVGIPPLHACGVAAMLGLGIQNGSANFFANGSRPGGVLSAPGPMSQATLDRLKAQMDTDFSGDGAGKTLVVSDGLTYHPMAMSAQHSQLNEQWDSMSKAIASCFHVPWHLVGGPPPPYNNIQALTVQYFTQCIQRETVQIETCLDNGFPLQSPLGTMFNVDDLLWMDSATMMSVIKEGVGAGVIAPNEGRKRINLGPVTGGESVYLQQQNYSLEALAKRDASADPFATTTPAPPEPPPAEDDMTDADAEKMLWDLVRREMDVVEA